jgi:phosphonate transport system substrate-binding protein
MDPATRQAGDSSSALALLAVLLVGCFSPPESGTYTEGPRAPPPPPSRDGLALPPGSLPTASLRLGLAPIVSADLMRAQHQGLADYLAETLAVPVDLIVADSYADIVTRLIEGRIDIAILPPATFAMARARSPDVKLLASQVAGGATSYSSYIVVRREAPYASLHDLEGKRVAFVDEASASGFLLPWVAFLDHDIDPRRAFASAHFAGNHVSAIMAVIDGRADAAATYSGMLDYTRRAGTASPEAADLRILHKAGRVPYDALCASPALKPETAARITAAFMSVDTSSTLGRKIYAKTSNHVSGWMRADEAQYESIRMTIARVATHRGQGDGHGRP